MAFNRPTLQQLITRTEGDLVSRLQITATVLRRALVRILARVWSGVVHGLHGHIVWATRQIFVSTADDEYLDLHGAEFAVERKSAGFAVGNATFAGTNDAIVPADTRLTRQDNVEYRTTVSGTIALGTATIAVTATAVGSNGNADAGVELSLVSPVPGVTSTAAIASGGITGGVDTEGPENYRARILARKRNPPHGGNRSDYEQWAGEVAGVTRAWVYPNHMGPGTVGVTFVCDGLPDIIPNSAKVSEVQAYIDARRPLLAQVDVFAPISAPLNLTIEVSPDTPAVRQAVRDELEDLLFREGEPGATLVLSHLDEAISSAAGEVDHDLVAPSADVPHDPNELPVLGVITWV
jgi:uncharacterized phage protein gp47/JayE